MLYGTLAPAQGAAADVHPLAYYSLLWGWMRTFGSSPVAVRAMSVLFGLGTVGLAFVLARRLFGRRRALILAFLVAVSPFQVHYAQEVRMYALLGLLLLGATIALDAAMRHGSWPRWALFAVLAAASQYTHHLAAFYLVPLAFTPIWRRDGRALRGIILAGLGALALYAPWLAQLPTQFAKVQQAYWTSRPSPLRLVTTLLTFNTNLPLPETWLPVALTVSVLAFAIGIWQTWLAFRKRSPGWRRGLWLAYLAFAPVLLLFVVSQWQPVFIERALLPSGVVYLLWLGWAVLQSPRPLRLLVGGGLLIGMAMGLFQHVTYSGFPYAPYRQVNAHIDTELDVGDVILHSNKLTMLPAVYYSPELPASYLADLPGSGSDTLAQPTQEVLELFAQPDPARAVGGASRVWFLFFQGEIEEYRALGYVEHPHLSWLEAHFDLARQETWGDLQLHLYER
jgi:4-amino-4-deoxy-L-arabinose transferase-like glycosyltransferase